MIKLVIFDFDGVIIDSSEAQNQAFFESYKFIGGKDKISFEEFLKHSGDSLENIFFKMNLPQEMCAQYRKISREKISLIKMYQGMEKLLFELRNNGFKCALCTGKDRVRTIEILKILKIEKNFRYIVCSDDVEKPKPDPESLKYILDNLKINIDEAIMVGDSRNDILCAKKIYMKNIAVTWGCTLRYDLELVSPDLLVNNIQELYEGIKRFSNQ